MKCLCKWFYNFNSLSLVYCKSHSNSTVNTFTLNPVPGEGGVTGSAGGDYFGGKVNATTTIYQIWYYALYSGILRRGSIDLFYESWVRCMYSVFECVRVVEALRNTPAPLLLAPTGARSDWLSRSKISVVSNEFLFLCFSGLDLGEFLTVPLWSYRGTTDTSHS